LARRPEERYQTCSQFVAALAAAFKPAPLQNPEETSATVSEGKSAEKPPARLTPYLIALAAVLLLAGASWFLFSKYAGQRAAKVVPLPAQAPIVAQAPANVPVPKQPAVEPKQQAAVPKPEVAVPKPVAPVPKHEPVVPVIQRFEADPPSIELGMSTKLSWSVTGATEMKLDHGIGPVAQTGTLVVSPLATTTYAMTATGASTDVHSTVSVEVKPAAGERPRRLYEEAVEMRRKGQLPESLALMRRAAAAGAPRAMVDLAECYRNGDGVAKDESQAVYWFRRAADLGNATAMVFLGYMYQEGEGVDKSDAEAVKWFQKAADKGNSSGLYNLATKYERGEGVGMSQETAVELYQKAAGMGNVEARRRLAQLNRKK
jgi:hypothetical protein